MGERERDATRSNMNPCRCHRPAASFASEALVVVL